MTTRMTQQEFESYLRGAAVILRGCVDVRAEAADPQAEVSHGEHHG